MILHKFPNYDQYLEVQTRANEEKLNNVWVTKASIDVVAATVQRFVADVQFGICHGARNGWEVYALRSLLGIEIIGTDISRTATRFEHLVQWDFHEVKPEWLNAVDFIYSNSLDHSFDPAGCLRQWMRCIKKSGVCLLHWSPDHGRDIESPPADCFQIKLDELVHFVERELFAVQEIVELPDEAQCLLVVRHR